MHTGLIGTKMCHKIQTSAIFSTYLPNLEALWHGIACVCTSLAVGRSGSFGSTKIVNKIFELKFFTFFADFCPLCDV